MRRSGAVIVLSSLLAVAACDPPGEGPRAQLGYRMTAPVIAALAGFHAQGHGYPPSLSLLVPKYLSAVPPAVNGYPLEYALVGASYELTFRYERPGMNVCTYAPERGWRCYGYF